MKLLADYQELHRANRFSGVATMLWVPEIAALVAEFGSKRLLDYGCGQGLQYRRERAHVVWGTPIPTLYDPAVPEFSALPIGRFDGVICTDVLEHVPEDELGGVVNDIDVFAVQWAFISVCCRPSRYVRLRNGDNVHVTIHSMEWWREYLQARFTSGARLVLRETK